MPQHEARSLNAQPAVGFVILSLGLLLAACTQNPVPEIAELDPGAPALPVVTAAGLTAEVWQQLQIDLNGDDLVGKDGALAHIGADLALLYRRHQAFVRQGSVGTFLPTRTYIRLSADRVVIDAVAVDDAAALLADLEALGLDHGATFGRYVSGRLPIAAIADAAALASLKFARPAAAMTWVGLTDSQGDASMRSDEARTLFAVDGSGVTIGTLSDSFDCFGDAATDVASGDLPAGIVVLDDLTGPDCIGAIDEGRAMMQLITDVAPGASQSFHTAFQGQADFASGIVELQAAGADVINDDVFYFAEPFFQDGIIAQAVDTVFAAGAAYFSSAGNANRSAYQSPFDPSGLACPAVLGPGFAPCEPHDFDPGAGVDIFQNVTIPEGTSFTQSFQWDEPFFSVSGAPGSANDYDIFLLNGAADTLLDFGAAINFGDDPVEIIQYTNPIGSGETSFNFLITKFDPLNTTDAGLMHFNLYGGNSIVFNEFGTNSPTSSGHSIAAGGQGVGAAFYQETPEFGVDPALPETFSSAGVLPILFDTSGNRLGTTGTDGTQLNIAEIRNKPDIVAPDGTNTTFFGSSDPELDGFPNFFGTSAAAPHAAAVAGLMKEFKPTLMPDQIYSALEDTALDMSALPIMQTAAFDFDTGFGLIQADAALASIDTPSIAFAQTAVSVDEGAGTATITVQRLGSSIGAVGVDNRHQRRHRHRRQRLYRHRRDPQLGGWRQQRQDRHRAHHRRSRRRTLRNGEPGALQPHRRGRGVDPQRHPDDHRQRQLDAHPRDRAHPAGCRRQRRPR